MSIIKVSFFIILLLSTQLSFGDIPQEISYQGLLTNAGGVPVNNGIYGLTFGLYQSDTGVAELWSENHASVNVVNGVFNVILGSINPLNLAFDNKYWLGVSINGGSELTPRIQITSTAYSLNARSVVDNSITNSKLADNAVTTGKIAGGQVVKSLNSLKDSISLLPGDNITITPGGNNLTISASGSSGWSLSGNSISSSNFLGSTNNQPLELWANNLRALRLEPNSNSPNIIGGYYGNIVDSGKFGGTISGGGTIGNVNQINNNYAAIGGGYNNRATGFASSIGGGRSNIADGQYVTVGGGLENETSDNRTTISGGQYNKASGYTATVGGGSGNEASGYMATVGGGSNGDAIGQYATVPGGRDNVAQGDYSLAAGRRAKANYSGCFVWGDSTDSDIAASGPNRFMVRSSGGLWFYSDSAKSEGFRIPAGNSAFEAVSNNPLELWVSGKRSLRLEPATESPKIILGNSSNSINSGAYGATISGGGGDTTANKVFDPWGTVSGGEFNQAGTNNSDYLDAKYITIGGGYGNVGTAHYATIGGGQGNDANGLGGTVAGGLVNQANGYASTVPGGRYCIASGDYSFAAGRQAKISGNGSFMWADSTDADFSKTASNRFYVRSSNGVYFYTASDLTSGSYLSAGGSSWNTISDRALKRNIRQVDGKNILERLSQIPVCQWSYKSQDPGIEHIGPIAQDFHEAFGLGGDDDKSINTVDPDGVALAAIQGLYELVKEKDERITELEDRITTLENAILELKQK